MKKLLMFIAAVLLILIGIWGSLMIYFDEQRLKELAIEQVRAQTGRELVINGPLDLDLFPRVALNIEDVSLSGPSDYTGPDFFAADELSLSLSLFPLIRGEVEAGDIELSGAEISLHTDRAGNSTLDGLSGEPGAAESSPSTEERPPITTGEIRLNNVNLVISDASSNELQRFFIERLQIDQFRFNQPIPFRFEGEIGEPPLVQDLQIDGKITIPSGAGDITVDDLELNALASEIGLTLEGDIRVNPGTPMRAELSDGQLGLADERYAVDFSYQDGARPMLQASLTGEMLDVDALLAGMAPAEQTAEPAAESPLLIFRDIDLNAELNLDAMRVSGLLLSGIQARAIAQNGILTLDPLSGTLAGGAMSATARIDLNQTPATVQLQPSFELSALDEALAPWGLDQFVSGAGDLNLNMSARGLQPGEIL
ncbi:MAG: AsmA family protein, partial [Pseudomonadota bacterium]